MDIKRVFLIVLDSFGIGEMPDAELFGDKGCNTLKSIRQSSCFRAENMRKLGLFCIDGISSEEKETTGSYARVMEQSQGKDTTIGHWEMAGVISHHPLPTYPDGFPAEVIEAFEEKTGRKVICNLPYSGTEVIRKYGNQHVDTGNLIVYTSADSVFQIAAHESVIPISELYRYCEIAREILCDKHAVGRVIARPFTGIYPEYQRTENRHDFSLIPPGKTMLDHLSECGFDTIAIGKINDIFSGQGIQESYKSKSNSEGMQIATKCLGRKFNGLCFVNLVDFDMKYGHRNDIDGYAKAIAEFDLQLGEFMTHMNQSDLLMITADHGCDPGYPGTDHTREYVPLLIYTPAKIKHKNFGTRSSFADVGATILDIFGVGEKLDGVGLELEN